MASAVITVEKLCVEVKRACQVDFVTAFFTYKERAALLNSTWLRVWESFLRAGP